MSARLNLSRRYPVHAALARKSGEAALGRSLASYWRGVSTGMGLALTAVLTVLALTAFITAQQAGPESVAVAVVDGETEILCRSWQPTGKPCGEGGCLWTQDCFECEVGGTGGCAYHHTNTSCYGSGMNSCPLLLSEAASGLDFRWSAVPGSWINEAGTALDQALRHAQD